MTNPELVIPTRRQPEPNAWRLINRRKYRKELEELNQKNALRFMGCAAIQWLVIAAAITAAVYLDHWLAYLGAIVVVGTRQYALAILMHDAAHFVISKNRTLNDTLSDLVCAIPVGMLTSAFRDWHLRHHSYTLSLHDPDLLPENGPWDWKWPKSKNAARLTIVLDLLGVNLLGFKMLTTFWSPWSRLLRLHRLLNRAPAVPITLKDLDRRETIMALGFAVTAIPAITWAGAWWAFFWLWWVPSATIFAACFKYRALADHAGTPAHHELNATRTVHANWFERLTVAPCNVNYHLEHHIFPSVPFWNLPRVRALLLEDPVYREHALYSPRYFGRNSVWQEITYDPEVEVIAPSNTVNIAERQAAERQAAERGAAVAGAV